jgi:hypothetical protein
MLQIAQDVLIAQKDGSLAASLLCVGYKIVVPKSELEDFLD